MSKLQTYGENNGKQNFAGMRYGNMSMSLKFQRLRAFLRWYEREMPRQAGHDKGVRLLGGNSQGLTVTRVSACGNLPYLLKRTLPTKCTYFLNPPLVFRPRCVLLERAIEQSESVSRKQLVSTSCVGDLWTLSALAISVHGDL